MNAMEDQGLLDSGDYFVVGVYLEQYRASDPAKYLRGGCFRNVREGFQAGTASSILFRVSRATIC